MSEQISAALAINSTYGQRASARVTGIENKVKASIRAVLAENWMETKEDELMRAAMAGVLLDIGVESDDGKRFVDSLGVLRKLSAIITAARKQESAFVRSTLLDEAATVLPLMGWWHDVKGE